MVRCSARPTSGLRRPVSGVRARVGRTPANPARPSMSVLMARPLKSPKNISSEAEKVLMGEITIRAPRSPEPPLQNSALDAALDRWKLAFEKAKTTG
jgi:hypothetical protein